ncbi:MAG: D-alanyl-D-alanine carboxypeptidase [Chitinophagaceae bacterium]
MAYKWCSSLCNASTFKGPLDIDSVRHYSQLNYLKDLPSPVYWMNGSGLPNNLFTVKTIISLLIKIRDKINNEQRLHLLLSNGGVNGTLAEAYKTDNGVPFVFGKTGTLQFVHNQSGFLITKKGKKLIFSFMNNNFARPMPEIRSEMVREMTEIHDMY